MTWDCERKEAQAHVASVGSLNTFTKNINIVIYNLAMFTNCRRYQLRANS